MRILIFSTNYLPHIGGAELAVKEVTDRLEEADCMLITAKLASDRPYFEKIGSVAVYRIGIGHRVDVFLLALFGWMLGLYLQLRHGFDLIWSMMASQGSIAAAMCGLVGRKPTVLTLQEGNEEEHLKRYVGGSDFLYKVFIRPFHYVIFSVADHITVISSHLKKRAKRISPDTPLSVIPNGVDTEEFTQTFNSQQIEEIRSRYASKEDTLIITTSRLAKKNAVSDLIDSLTYLPDHCKLLVLGDGPLEGQLKDQVENLNLDNRVFLPGSVDFKTVPKYLKAADVFVRPSLSEGMGNSFIEAMAARLPAVGTPVGGIVDFLKHEETGLFAEVENPESIAKQIQRLDEDDHLRNRVVENAYKMVTEQYNWDNIAPQYEDVFSHVISQSG